MTAVVLALVLDPETLHRQTVALLPAPHLHPLRVTMMRKIPRQALQQTDRRGDTSCDPPPPLPMTQPMRRRHTLDQDHHLTDHHHRRLHLDCHPYSYDILVVVDLQNLSQTQNLDLEHTIDH